MAEDEPVLDLCDFTAQSSWERFVADIAQHLRSLDAAEPSAATEAAAAKLAEGVRVAAPELRYSSARQCVLAGGVCTATVPPDADDLFAPEVVHRSGAFGSMFALYRECRGNCAARRPRLCVQLCAADSDTLDERDVPLLLSALVCAAADTALDNTLLLVVDSTGAASGYQLPPRGASAAPLVAATEQVRSAREQLCFLDGLFPHALGKFTAVGRVDTSIAVQFLFVLRSYASAEWRYAGARPAGSNGPAVLRWGPQHDPIEQLSLSLQWLTTEPMEDSQASTKYDSHSASRWVLRAGFARPAAPLTPQQRYHTHLADGVWALLKAWRACRQFTALTQLSGSSHVHEQRLLKSFLLQKDAAALVEQEQTIEALLDTVFDAAAHTPAPPSPSSPQQAQAGGGGRRPAAKGAAPGSLLERLAMCVLETRGLTSCVLLWLAFVARVRTMVEAGRALPATGNTPNYQHCLLEQKLCSVCSHTTTQPHNHISSVWHGVPSRWFLTDELCHRVRAHHQRKQPAEAAATTHIKPV